MLGWDVSWVYILTPIHFILQIVNLLAVFISCMACIAPEFNQKVVLFGLFGFVFSISFPLTVAIWRLDSLYENSSGKLK